MFSGCGGMSAGFAARPGFRLAAAVDFEVGKPSGRAGDSSCNRAYEANLGIAPMARDIRGLKPSELMARAAGQLGREVLRGDIDVLSACPPCTDFTRAKPGNHSEDGERNSMVGVVADFVADIFPRFVVMENTREFLSGRHRHHFDALLAAMRGHGYTVSARIHTLSRFGLPQERERAIVVASRDGVPRDLDDLWDGLEAAPAAATVGSAMGRLSDWRAGRPADPMDVAPGLTPALAARLSAIPRDGGSWSDLGGTPEGLALLIPSHRRRIERGGTGSHPDVYGRMAWDRPAPTIKRECSHVGNGRYSHPDLDRLMTVREMASLQGFPFWYQFPQRGVSSRYRVIGDAVPPLVSYQIAAAVEWAITGERPGPTGMAMPASALLPSDISAAA